MPTDAAATPPSSTGPFVAGPFRLHPFRGLMLSPDRVGDPSSARAVARPYRDVARRLRSWEEQGRVLRDAEPAVYLHEYTTDGVAVRGLVGALDLTHQTDDPALSVVLPHEATHPVQVRELADRMEEMRLNPAPILLVHRGPAAVRRLVGRTASGRPDHDYTDHAGQRHRVWAIRDPEVLGDLTRALQVARALVADGHHRLAAYLSMQQRRPGGAADLGLAMLVDQDDTPLHLEAIHRVLPGAALDDVASLAHHLGRFTEHPGRDTVAPVSPTTVVLTDGLRWGTLTLAGGAAGDRAAVEVVDELLPTRRHAPRVGFHHSVDAALAALTRTPGVAVLLPAPDFDVVGRTLATQRLLPEKATSFQPKPSLGVLMRSLLDG